MDATGGRHMDPATATKRLGEAPAIDPSASLRDTRLGRYCEVGARTKLAECVFGDYSYVANDSDIIYATLGRFCSIAAQVR
ncbi:chloramphenicol acetyltransferase, partial [Roseomonas sp. DSM 102946]|nr:chloramphenicol acetyltransferase [Roseomonas sp. DSM 102946]